MTLRISSDLWVTSYLRKCRLNGSFAYLAKRGATDAGAIFIKVVLSDGTANLYGPAPQSAALDVDDDVVSDGDGRIFERLLVATDEVIEARLYRERNFDSDIWIVEVENAHGQHGLRLTE